MNNNFIKAKLKLIEDTLLGKIKIRERLLLNIEDKKENLEQLMNVFFNLMSKTENNEQENEIYDNLIKIFILINFGCQFEIIQKIKSFKKIPWKESIFEKTNEFFIISDEEEFEYYQEILNLFFEQDNKNYFKDKDFNFEDKLIDFFDLKDDSIIQKDEEEMVNFYEEREEIVFNRKNVAQLKNQSQNIIKNPTLLANKILEKELINNETLKFLEKNLKFLNASTHSLFSKFFLKELMLSDENDKTNKKTLINFIVFLYEKNNVLFNRFLNNFKKFVRDDLKENDYFENNKEAYIMIIGELNPPPRAKIKLYEVFEIEDEKNNHHFMSREKQINITLTHNEMQQIVYNYYQGKGYNAIFDEKKKHKKLLEEFVLTFFEMFDLKILVEKVKGIADSEDLKNVKEINEYVAMLKKLTYFFSKTDIELKNYFYYLFGQKIKETNLFKDAETDKEDIDTVAERNLLILTCVEFIQEANEYIKGNEQEKEMQTNDIKQKLLKAFTGKINSTQNEESFKDYE